MTRLPDWRGRLGAHLAAARARPFCYGTHDCATFAAGAVEAGECHRDRREALADDGNVVSIAVGAERPAAGGEGGVADAEGGYRIDAGHRPDGAGGKGGAVVGSVAEGPRPCRGEVGGKPASPVWQTGHRNQLQVATRVVIP